MVEDMEILTTAIVLRCSVVSGSSPPHELYVARQAPLSMGFSRQEHCHKLPFPSLGDLPDPRIEPTSPAFPTLVGGSLATSQRHLGA